VSLLARFLDPDGHVQHGIVGDDTVVVGEGELLHGELRPTGRTFDLARVKLLAPVAPRKVVAVARNYAEHAKELGNDVPDAPRLFIKPSTAVIGPGDAILLPPRTTRVDHEAELGVIIGRTLDWRGAADPMRAVAGYTCLDDVTARDLQKTDGQWTRAKGFDTFCPIGPTVMTGLDYRDLEVICRVNGTVRQHGHARDMMFSIPRLVSYVSGIMTLEPGDVIATGTPEGVGPLVPGDMVEVEIPGIGLLANPVTGKGMA